ncbi:hypothetical protein SDC9_169052 [bioreactor metagenome]|uniref:Uncharacterized protein n=1 Tax=bioreactor metagenome TaxID=1076179 RepID=A0A645G6U0_9ZZZZ
MLQHCVVLRNFHRIVGGEETTMRNLDVGQLGLDEVAMEIPVGRLAGVGLAHDLRCMLQVERGADGRCAIHEIVVLDGIGRQPLEEEQRLVHFDVPGIDGNDKVARVEEGRAVFVHELHQREENRPAGAPEARMYRQRGNLGDLSFLLAHIGQVEDALQRKTDGAFTDQRQRADHLVVELGAERGGRRQGVIDRHPHAGWIGGHEAAADVGVVQELEAGLKFLLGFGDLEDQTFVGFPTVYERTIDVVPALLRQHREQLAGRLGNQEA